MKFKIIALALLGILIYSCSPKVVPQVVEVKKEMSPEIAEGKSLYENNCAKCHKLFDTKQFTAEEWTPIVLRMQKKARIDDATRDKIYAYVTMR
jgi:mono/diheme cytochrome c family protein